MADTANATTFLGEFEHSTDDKGRVIIPSDFRTGLGSKFIATRGPDRCVWLMPESFWNEILARLGSDFLHPAAGFLQRMFGSRTEVSFDAQFRLAVPKHLRDWAGITADETTSIIGQGPKIELWRRGAWLEQNSQTLSSSNMYDSFRQLAASVPAGE